MGKAYTRMQQDGVDFKDGLLSDVYDTVRETLEYDEAYASDLASKYNE